MCSGTYNIYTRKGKCGRTKFNTQVLLDFSIFDLQIQLKFHYLRFRWKLRGRLEIPGVIWRGFMKRLRAAASRPGLPSAETPLAPLVAHTSPPDRAGGSRP